jgi:hypothetical protein
MQKVSEIRVSLWRLMVMTVHLGSLTAGGRRVRPRKTQIDASRCGRQLADIPSNSTPYGVSSKSMSDAQALKNVSGVAYCMLPGMG